jgi:hypothetical protein
MRVTVTRIRITKEDLKPREDRQNYSDRSDTDADFLEVSSIKRSLEKSNIFVESVAAVAGRKPTRVFWADYFLAFRSLLHPGTVAGRVIQGVRLAAPCDL